MEEFLRNLMLAKMSLFFATIFLFLSIGTKNIFYWRIPICIIAFTFAAGSFIFSAFAKMSEPIMETFQKDVYDVVTKSQIMILSGLICGVIFMVVLLGILILILNSREQLKKTSRKYLQLST